MKIKNSLFYCIIALFFLVVLLVLHAGYNYCFEPDEIFMTYIERENTEIVISIDCLNSSKMVKRYKYFISDRKLIIRLYGGWIFPWDHATKELLVKVPPNMFDAVIIEGRKTPK